MKRSGLHLNEAALDGNHRLQITAYNELAPLNQDVLHILSIIYQPVARTYILNSLKRLLPTDPNIKTAKVKLLNPILKDLMERGLAKEYGTLFGCEPFLMEPLCRLLSDNGRFDETAAAVQSSLPVAHRRGGFMDYTEIIREVRIGLYRGDAGDVRKNLAVYEKHFIQPSHYNSPRPHPFIVILKHAFDADWVARNVPKELQADMAKALASHYLQNYETVGKEILAFLTAHLSTVGKADAGDRLRIFLAEQMMLDGRIDAAETLFSGKDGAAAIQIRGAASFLRGKAEEAIAHYETALALIKTATRRRKIYFDTRLGLFHILAILKSGGAQDIQNAKDYCRIAAKVRGGRLKQAYEMLLQLFAAREGDPDALEVIRQWAWTGYFGAVDPYDFLIGSLVVFWMDKKKARNLLKPMKLVQSRVELVGSAWLIAQYASLLSKLSGKNKAYRETAETFFDRTGIQRLTELIQPESPWQQALNALINLKRANDPAVDAPKQSRLIWLLDWEETRGYWQLFPREQVLSAKGTWSNGRRVALKRLYYEREQLDFLTPQDRAVCACITEDNRTWRGYPDITYSFEEGALKALAGHPRVFWADSPEVQVEIVTGRLELLLSKHDGGQFEIAFSHAVDPENKLQLTLESPTRLKVIDAGEDVLRIAKIVGKGLRVPASGKTRLMEAVESISPLLTVQSQVAGLGPEAEEIAADPTPRMHLRPFGAGLKMEVMVQPFAQRGPCFRPGEGGETVISEIDGRLLRTRRDLDLERRLTQDAAAACPTLEAFGESDGRKWAWALTEPADCLEALMELRAVTSPLALAWPEGESFRLRQQADLNRFFMNIRKKRDWFSVSGELRLEDGLVLSMEQLLSLLETAQGRFLQLEDGRFLALTREFEKRLEDLAAYSKKSGKDRQFHPLSILSLEEIAEKLGGLRADKHWKTHIQRATAARALNPQVPSTFKAELRDYQLAGFRWLARLSHWGVGACLADDMGLGKTLQALAVMLTRAAEGPSLVVAPTSVCMNWECEAARFAPALHIVTLGSGARDETVRNLKSFDMLLVSYGLLQQEEVAGMLSKVHFTTVVLDEAQAIKNLATKRSKAAMELDADFRLITTGTPIENHLGELWNLFQFINPGFLGSLKEFTATFAVPIEKHQDRDTRRRLKRLLQPFILRRTKNQVLEELPQRTDILMQVDLSPEELAFYEALRRKALETLDAGDGSQKGFQLAILAEIMKLRRACCNPKLVAPDMELPSAKLAVFGEIVDELLENGHKALVFSQFTGHLAIIREYVAQRAIVYQYLDGATPQGERKKRVEAFQGGDGELFLISLKAGGLGLNLTAADYVIHMDPWWNPAVEDQASDRAHRIGQTRPVTVYSLVARHTIEEKIVALHRTKRDLADSLLEGADMSGKMSSDELLRLIREG
jgi:hypothetical protein